MISPKRFSIPILMAALAFGMLGATRAADASPPYATSDESAGRSELYQKGQQALSAGKYQDAADLFDRLAAQRGAEADAALYWKAYASAKAGRKGVALDAIRTLRSTYPESSWDDDAAALELSLRDSGREDFERQLAEVEREAERAAERAERDAERAGREAERVARDAERAARDVARGASRAASQLDEKDELKLYAINGLMQADPDKAVPVLEKFLQSEPSPLLKERALFVLSQSDSPRAREILLGFARNGQPIELRTKAIQMFGIAGEPEDMAALGQLYRDGNPQVRGAILEAWMIADATAPVLAAAKEEKDVALRGRAIELLGVMDAQDALADLWARESDPALKRRLLDAFAISGDSAMLAKAARGEKDPALRVQAIRGLGLIDDENAGRELLSIYESSSDLAAKRAVLDGLMIRDDAKTLIALFRKETDPALKREIVQKLSLLDSDEAADELARLLGGKS